MEKIFYNGKVVTVDAARPRARAFAVVNGRIAAVGSNAAVLALRQAGTGLVDLSGATVLPGFNDSHMHLLSVGSGPEKADLSSATSRQELVRLGREFSQEHPARAWVLGRGWSQESFPDKTMPSRYDLDEVAANRPVYFVRVCGHVAVANSCALEMAGITANTAPPAGGQIDLDAHGTPTGILRENALGLVANLLPSYTLEDYKRMFVAGANTAISYGITSVTSDDIGELADAELKLEALQELICEQRFPLRYNIQARVSMPEQVERLRVLRERYTFPPHTVEFGPLKLMCDGSLGGRTAALNEPYSDDPANRGVAILPEERIDEMFALAHAHGWQVSAHAIGDRTMEMLLHGFRHMLRQRPQRDARPRIIHAQITNEHILNACRELGVVCDIQPVFVANDHPFVESRVGKERAKLSYAWKTMLDLGIAAGGGSDAPVADCNPLLGIYAAVTRQDTTGNPPNGWLPEQKLTLEEAIHLFTLGSAFASFHEHILGSISVHKLADFVVLSDDLTQVSPAALKDVTVLATYIGGECVYGTTNPRHAQR
ncbi:MAG: N-substituted formamide deformylase [Firmicutes bacterium]|nr:N-substituted formamide deformylase [candidate division NPL-UPA2 bacterium]